jgi:O-antigen/teichoic acid export membrane protein
MGRWDSKTAFLTSRGLLAVAGFIRTIVIVRLLTLDDYALLGVVEAIRGVIETVFGLAIIDSLSREGAAESDKDRLGQLVAVAYFNTLVLGLASGLAFWVVSLYSQFLLSDPRLPALVILAFVVSLAERMLQISLTVLQITNRQRVFVISTFIQGIVGTVTTIAFVWVWGVFGYFYSLIIILGLFAVIAAAGSRRLVSFPSVPMLVQVWTMMSSRLWNLSWSMYLLKGSGVLWRRAPLLLAAPLASQALIGAVSAALDLSNKIHILQQAVSPLIVPRLSRALANGGRNFVERAKDELFEIGGLNVIALLIAVSAWAWLGAIVLTEERWMAIGSSFYFALLVECTLIIAHVAAICVLIPTSNIGELSVATVLIRLFVVPIFFLCVLLGADMKNAIFLALLLPGAVVAALFITISARVLRALKA